MQIVFAGGGATTNFERNSALYVNNCGYYRDVESDITVNRPQGRSDYHILIVSQGMMKVGERELQSGDCYLYLPSAPQFYRYESGEGSEYYWIHFGGYSLPELFERFGLKEGAIYLGAALGECKRLIKMMLLALDESYRYSEEYCEGLLRALLSLISAPPSISTPYYKAIRILSDPADTRSVDEIASIYNISTNHFIRSFKQYTGSSPNAFRTEKRMSLAQEMLVSTEMSVERIALAVGYSDPLYFSRAFRKKIGVSPSEYRKNVLCGVSE